MKLDDKTLKHLDRYLSQNSNHSDVQEKRSKIIYFLENSDSDTANYWLDLGWRKICEHLFGQTY